MYLQIIFFIAATVIIYMVIEKRSAIKGIFTRKMKRLKNNKYMDILTPEDRMAQMQEHEQRRNRINRQPSSEPNNGFSHLFGEDTGSRERTVQRRRAPQEADVVELPLPHPDTFAPKRYRDQRDINSTITQQYSDTDMNKIAKMKERAIEFITRFDKESEKNRIKQTDPFNSDQNALNNFFRMDNQEQTQPINPAPQAQTNTVFTQNMQPSRTLEEQVRPNDATQNINPFAQQNRNTSPFESPISNSNVPMTQPAQANIQNNSNISALPQDTAETEQPNDDSTSEVFNKVLGYQKKEKSDSEWKPIF